jgi:hypothetical protein
VLACVSGDRYQNFYVNISKTLTAFWRMLAAPFERGFEVAEASCRTEQLSLGTFCLKLMLVIYVFRCVTTKLSLLTRHIALPDLGSSWTVGDTFGRLLGLENCVDLLQPGLWKRLLELGGPVPAT